MRAPSTLLLLPIAASGHGYLSTPRSRNVYAQLETRWWGATAADPRPENCMQCLATRTPGGCGRAGQNSYDLPRNARGGLMGRNVQEVYAEGQVITVGVVLTAHHKGHFVFSACPIRHGEAPRQRCFDANRLMFVADLLHGGKADKNYPERAYVAPSNVAGEAGDQYFEFRMRLPDGLVGDLVLIQWHYLTGNSCMHDGYLKYDWPKSWNYDLEGMDRCGPRGEGAEQFWNCAEVKIEARRYITPAKNSSSRPPPPSPRPPPPRPPQPRPPPPRPRPPPASSANTTIHKKKGKKKDQKKNKNDTKINHSTKKKGDKKKGRGQKKKKGQFKKEKIKHKVKQHMIKHKVKHLMGSK